MYLKDYYAILGLSPSAGMAEIKKAYRQLAHQHHPDKTNNDKAAQAIFAEIKEAYEVLTNPSKKEYYLQQRWFNQSMGKRRMQKETTPFNILQQALELERHVAGLDIYRMDKTGLKDYILELLSIETIEKLKPFDDPTTSMEIIRTILKAMHPLPPYYSNEVLNRLRLLAVKYPPAEELISQFENKQNRKHQQQKYSLLFIIIITGLLCLLIYFASR